MKPRLRLAFAIALLSTHPCLAQEHLANPAANQRIDGTLFTTYTRDYADTSLSLSVCGSTQNTTGCYGGASLGPFGKVGAILESNPRTDLSTNTVTRSIYVLDIASGASKNGVSLLVYTKTDMITPDFDTVTVTLSNTVTLPLVGGLSASASMAANNQFLFIGTNQSPQGVEMNKRTLTPVLVGGFSPPINVSAISADQYGYVTMTFGSFTGGESGFYLFGQDGSTQEDGGGAAFTVGTTQAVLPGAFH